MAWFMGSRWSHSFVIVDPSKYCWVCETTDFEVTCSPLNKYDLDPNVEMEVWRYGAMSDTIRELVAERAMEKIGTVYGYLQLISLGLRRLLMRVGIKIPNFIRQGMVCCHVVDYAYQDTGLIVKDAESIDTQELYEIVKKKFTRIR